MKRLALGVFAFAVLTSPFSIPCDLAVAGDLTLPFESQQYYVVNAWLDHTSPVAGDPDPTVTRYDEALGVPYDSHRGIDFPLPGGTQVLAAAAGDVVAAGWEPCGGNYMRVYHSTLGYSTLCLHLQPNFIVTSGPVARRQPIAYSDNSGYCTEGAHLHFTARNGQTGSNSLDPYGWSGTGNDPWPPGQAFGHLFAIRLGVNGGGGVWAAEGTLTAPGRPEDPTATSFAMAGARIGTIRNGNAWAKDGELDAGWWGGQPIYTGATAIAMSGRRVGIIASANNTAFVKEGDLSAQWVLQGSGVNSIAVTHDQSGLAPNRIGILLGDIFMVKEGGTGGAFTTVASNAAAIALGGGWMGYIHQNGNAYTKVGLNDYWTLQIQGGVTFMSLGGAGSDRRIGIIRNNIAIARVGEDPWVSPLYTGATKIRVNSGRVAVLTNEGQVKAKEGSLNEGWTPLSPNVTDIQLN